MKSLKNSLKLVSAAWAVLKKDRKILKAFVVQAISTVVIWIGAFGLIYLIGFWDSPAERASGGTERLNGAAVVIAVTSYLAVRLLAEFTAAYVTVVALGQFRGNPVGHGAALQKVSQAKRGIIKFGLLSATIGLVLQMAEERLPFFAAITAWLLNAAWQIAAMFAIVVIVDTGEDKPLAATRQSISVLKKSFGDNVRINFGLGLVVILAIMALITAIVPLAALFAAVGLDSVAIIGAGILSVIGVSIILLLMAALGAIIKAGLYEYANSGQVATGFDKTMFEDSVIEKKRSRFLHSNS